MRKTVLGILGTGALVIAGAGAAVAATSGGLNVSTDGAYTSGGVYNFKYSGCRWGTSSVAAYDGYVGGTLVVTTPNIHLNAKVDGYGWAKIKQGNSKTSYGYSSCLSGRDVIVHGSISLQVCREHWYGDDCSSKTVNR
ncbi:hypothetical protein [Nocardioides sp.]|uniref:hypothetical protein n=1 Tax=Nocardioides sp. TaxID=35761 RepID=UPI0026184E60|nr:hypothetical protein [Nocardioides sp.]